MKLDNQTKFYLGIIVLTLFYYVFVRTTVHTTLQWRFGNGSYSYTLKY